MNDQSRAVWLQTSLYINTTPGNNDNIGFDQQSFVNVALGGVENAGLVGARRGGSSVDITFQNDCGTDCNGPPTTTTTRDQVAFTGDIATLAGPDGSHFLGKDEPNIVIGFDSTGTHNIGRDIPLNPNSSSVENQSGSTYHIGIGNGPLASQPDQTLEGSMHGYAAGMVQSRVYPGSPYLDSQDAFLNVVASTSPDDFNINFNKATNTLFANLTVNSDILGGGDGATSAYHIGFGDPETPANKSAYIDDVHYAAIETPDATSVRNDGNPYPHAQSTAYLASGQQLGVDTFLQYPIYNQETQQVEMAAGAFCQDCDFLQWGAWGARFGFGEQSTSGFTDNVHLGWWVAGDVITDGVENGLPLLGRATYAGNVIGNVASNLNDQSGWVTYVATGNMNMSWNFGTRSGQFDVTNFDKLNVAGGLNFGGAISMPGGAIEGPASPQGGFNKFSGRLGNEF